MQGNCTEPPPPIAELGLSGPPLQWQAPQCLIIADSSLFLVWSRLWLDALYLRARPSRWYLFHFIAATGAVSTADVYGTRLRFQGDGRWNTTAIDTAAGARVYIQGDPSAVPARPVT